MPGAVNASSSASDRALRFPVPVRRWIGSDLLGRVLRSRRGAIRTETAGGGKGRTMLRAWTSTPCTARSCAGCRSAPTTTQSGLRSLCPLERPSERPCEFRPGFGSPADNGVLRPALAPRPATPMQWRSPRGVSAPVRQPEPHDCFRMSAASHYAIALATRRSSRSPRVGTAALADGCPQRLPARTSPEGAQRKRSALRAFCQ